jgi:DNA-binding LacI/PurR family transcriptional regulator
MALTKGNSSSEGDTGGEAESAPPERIAPKGKGGRRRVRREPSVRQLAESLNVSVATVSRALNNHPEVSDDTRHRVVEAARQAGYVQTVGKRPTSFLGLIFPDEQPSEFGGFEALILSGILRAARANQYDLSIVDPTREKHAAESYTQFFQRKGIAGVLLRGAEGSKAATELAAEGFPSVMIAGRSRDPRVSFVDGDSRLTSRQAVQHLIELGHRRIALGTHVVDDDDHQDRREGYLDAIQAAGIPVDHRLIVRTPVDQRGGVLMLERLLSLEDPPTAIYFTNPLPTVGALIRCAQLSIRVPEELSIIGFDDGDVRFRTYPTFSAVTQDAQAIAVDATRWLLGRIAGNAVPVYRELRGTQFCVEESTAFAPSTPVRLSPNGEIVRTAV